MAALTPPFSTATVDVPDGLVDRYVEAGWKRVESESPKRGAARSKESENK